MVKRIGLYTVDIESSYSEMLWAYVSQALENTEFDLIILPINNPEHPQGYFFQHNVLLNFIHEKNIDVLILMPELLGNFLSKKKFEKLITRIRENIPIVSLNLILEEAPSLIIDNTTGITQAIDHLISDHHYNKIAFLSGPENNSEALERKEAYLRAMKAHNIIPKNDWIFSGDFTPESAHFFMRENGPKIVKEFDAIFCANDDMAIATIKTLQQTGYSIPDDLAVIGFDNITQASFHNPPLTTIQQPFKEILLKAAEIAVNICLGKNCSDVFEFESNLIIRNSCGCKNFLSDVIYKEKLFDKEINPQSIKKLLQREFIKFLNPDISQRIENSIDNLLAYLSHKHPTKDDTYNFLIYLESFINEELYTYNSFPDWQKIISLLLGGYNQVDLENYQVWKQHDLLGKTMLLINRKERIWCGYNEAKRLENYAFPLRSLQQNMSTVSTTKETVKVVAQELDNIGIKNCYITLLVEGAKRRGLYSTIEEESDLILSYKEGQWINGSKDNRPKRFKTLDLLPPEIFHQSSGNSWFVSPLYNKNQLFGFIISDCKDYSGSIFESLRHQLSITLHSCSLNEKRITAEKNLKDVLLNLEKANIQLEKDSMYDEMTSLLNRRGFIKEATLRMEENSLNKTKFCLFFADMDGLKKINDTLGHASGDKAIKKMSEIIKQIFRKEDIIARLGGDEFTIFTIDIPDNFPQIIQQRLTNLLDNYNSDKNDFLLSVSIGHIKGYINELSENLSSLMDKADKKLYEDKRKKRMNPL